MTQPAANGPDPMDGLRLALLQQRAEEMRKRLRFGTFGMKEGLLVLMLAGGITILALTEPGRSHTLQLVLGWGLIVQAGVLYWSLRQTASQELQRLTQRISTLTESPDGRAMEQVAGAAQELLLRK